MIFCQGLMLFVWNDSIYCSDQSYHRCSSFVHMQDIALEHAMCHSYRTCLAGLMMCDGNHSVTYVGSHLSHLHGLYHSHVYDCCELGKGISQLHLHW